MLYNQHTPVLTLALDTSSRFGSIAVMRDGAILGSICTESSEAYSSRLFRQLEFLLGELSLALPDFDLYAVANGPGSFTGLRVGLTAAKGWAELYRKPIVAVSSLAAVAAQGMRPQPGEMLIPVLDARRGELFFGFYGAPATAQDPQARALQGTDSIGSPREFAEALRREAKNARLRIVTPSPALPPVTDAVSSGVVIEAASPYLAVWVADSGAQRAAQGQVLDALSLDASYVRRSDAELHWKGP